MMDPNLMIGIVGAVSGLLGAFGGAAISGWISWKIFRKQIQISEAQKKLENTFALHREFEGEALNTSRTLGAKLLESHPHLSLEAISETMDGPETVHIWAVLGFYKRLALSLKHGQLDERYVSDLFGAMFTWWWTICYQNKLPGVWVDHGIIGDLWAWFQTHTRADTLKSWIKRAEYDKPRYLGSASGGNTPTIIDVPEVGQRANSTGPTLPTQRPSTPALQSAPQDNTESPTLT